MLAFFASASRVSFNRPLAMRTLSEMTRAIMGDGELAWIQRLVEAGESLDLRIRSTELSVKEAIRLVREGIPVARCCQIPGTTATDSPLAWIALKSVRRGRIEVVDLAHESTQWMTVRQLTEKVSASPHAANLRWITGQPAMPCALTHNTSTGRRPVRPFQRLMGILRADVQDLWAVVTFSAIVGVLALATPIAVEALVNTVAFGRYLQPVLILSCILLTFLGFRAALSALSTLVVEIIQRRLFVRAVEDLAYRLPRVEQEALDKYYGPELTNRFFDIVTVQKVTAKLLLDGIAIVLQTVLGMAVLAFYHPFLLGFDLVLLMAIVFIVFALGRHAVKTAIVESASKYEVAAWLQELARHPTAFKLHGGAQFGLDRADQLAVNYLDARRSHFRIVMRQIVFALALQAIAATALLGLGGWLVIQGELTLGQLVAAELIVMNIVSSFAKIGKYVESFYDLLASTDKLGKLFDLPIEPHDRLFHLQDATAAHLGVQAVTQTLGHHVPSRPLTFDVAPQQRLALVGSAGSGKSILLDLFTGVRHPAKGNITLDHIDLRELRPDSLREHVSLARDIEIFHGTVEENVHLNRPQINASAVRQALQDVGVLEELMCLPDGLGTTLQTGGAPLSRSQSRRLMLARAIVGRPRLLLLDGILDELSDPQRDQILAFLGDDKRPWSLVVATGREAIAQWCDQILNLDTRQTTSTNQPSASTQPNTPRPRRRSDPMADTRPRSTGTRRGLRL